MPASFHLQSSKYNGMLHYHYAVEPVQRSPDRLITYAAPGRPVKSYRGSWSSDCHLLSFFWQAKPYVLHVRWKDDWQPHFLYVDIVTATRWTETSVHYIDMDLDVILRPAQPTIIHLDDEDEFESHRTEWNYPDLLVDECRTAVNEVRTLFQSAAHPFTPTLYAWRPGHPAIP